MNLTLRQRQPRVKDDAFLRFVRTLPCTTCGKAGPNHAAHIRMSSAEHGVINPGVGAKPSDRYAVPLCPKCHLYTQHAQGERQFWEGHGLDPFAVAKKLFEKFERDRKRK